MLCVAYAAQRGVLMAQIGQLLPDKTNMLNHMEIKRNRKVILDIFIKGTKNKEINIQLFSVVTKFIKDSERFTRN